MGHRNDRHLGSPWSSHTTFSIALANHWGHSSLSSPGVASIYHERQLLYVLSWNQSSICDGQNTPLSGASPMHYRNELAEGREGSGQRRPWVFSGGHIWRSRQSKDNRPGAEWCWKSSWDQYPHRKSGKWIVKTERGQHAWGEKGEHTGVAGNRQPVLLGE